MYRLYCLIGTCRYYRYKGNMWGMWSHHAERFSLEKAQQLAQSEECQFEHL
jgi:hypothetical protein